MFNIFSKPEKGALHDPGKIGHLLRVKIGSAHAILFSPVFPCIFFRPEEDALFSEGFDDVRILKNINFDIRNKD